MRRVRMTLRETVKCGNRTKDFYEHSSAKWTYIRDSVVFLFTTTTSEISICSDLMTQY